ncbi:UDP-glucose dehydrogenase family protein [Candidatus Neomarinimicrobiota bacterium]
MKEIISVFGLGKLGCTMLACFASKGWQVIGMDISEKSVNDLNNGKSPIYEPGVQEMITEYKENISATTDTKYAIMNSDISFVIVPTPSTIDGTFSTDYVEAVAAEVGSFLRTKESYHNVVITSTVLPGNMTVIQDLLERTSGKKCSEDFGLCYNPDFIALGSVVRDFLNPDMILIGESDKKAGDTLENIHHNLIDNKPNVHRMNFYNAELTKIALNSYCTLKITFANTLAEICEKMPGGNVDHVTNALGDDSRIGRKYLKGGLSYGGPCFPRDNRAFAKAAEKFGCTTPLAVRTDQINDYHRNERIPNKLLALMKDNKTDNLSILGLTYKTDTQIVEESAAISIINTLVKEDVQITIYDPAGMNEAKKEITDLDKIQFANSAKECLTEAKVCFIATPWKEFSNLSKMDFLDTMSDNPTIVDGWNMFSFDNDNDIKYVRIGRES